MMIHYSAHFDAQSAGRTTCIPTDSSRTSATLTIVLTLLYQVCCVWSLRRARRDHQQDGRVLHRGLYVAFHPRSYAVAHAFLDEEQLCKIAIVILEQKAYCQTDPDQDESEEAPEDSAELEGVLIGSACDLVSSMAIALGEKFQAAFQTFFPLITKYYVRVYHSVARSFADNPCRRRRGR